MAQQPDYDQTLKRLLTRAHDAFLALVAPGMRWIGETSPELPAIARPAVAARPPAPPYAHRLPAPGADRTRVAVRHLRPLGSGELTL